MQLTVTSIKGDKRMNLTIYIMITNYYFDLLKGVSYTNYSEVTHV